MSLASYRRNVRLGVSGRNTSTCFTAVCEMLSPNGEIKPETHDHYARFCEWSNLLDQRDRIRAVPFYANLLDMVFRDLGYDSWRDITFRRASCQWAIEHTIEGLMATGHKVLMDVNVEGEPHAVGLVPVRESKFELVSTWIPRVLKGEVTYDDLYTHRDVTDDPYLPNYSFFDTNITALPPID